MFSMDVSDTHQYPQNLNDIRKTEFSRLKDTIYLDHAGSTLYAKSQIDEYGKDLLNNIYGNPHSANPSSNLTEDIIHQVRCCILSHFNVTSNEYQVVFTSGATGAVKALARSFAWSKGRSRFVYLQDNHTSVVGIRGIAAENGVTSSCLSYKQSIGIGTGPFALSQYTCTNVEYRKQNNATQGEIYYNLFAYPAQSNFSGCKYPLSWINDIRSNGLNHCSDSEEKANRLKPRWSVLLDAAGYVSTSCLDLKKYSPDFICLSFYKMFGFPTGIGALLVRCESQSQLSKKAYFGGGTVDGYLPVDNYMKPRRNLHSWLEDGTLPFLDILALKHGFDALHRISNGSMTRIQDHTFSLIKQLYNGMVTLKHYNGANVIKVYSLSNIKDSDMQGPVLAFNVMRSDGSYVGFNHVLNLASSCNIHLRGGCFCNIGACISMLGLESNELKQTFESGHSCGDHIDLVKGYPVGSLRVSLGYMSTSDDIEALLRFLQECFLEVNVLHTDEPDEDVFYDALTNQEPYQPQVFLKYIFVYPVKSCRAMKVSEWEVCETGLKYDRTWMIVDEYGASLTLKREHKLALIQPTIDIMESTLWLSAEGVPPVAVPLEIENTIEYDQTISQSKVCGDRVQVYDCGSDASDWLTDVLGRTASLVYKRPNIQRLWKEKRKKDRIISEEKAPTLALTNEAQFLMISESTVEYLKRIMLDLQVSPDCLYVEDKKDPDCETEETRVDAIVRRFRSNFVIAGAKPFTEESWTDVVIKTASDPANEKSFVQLRFAGLCNRCSMVCIDADTGKPSREPLRTLGTLPPPKQVVERLSDLNKKSIRRTHFGVYFCTNAVSGILKVGSSIIVQ